MKGLKKVALASAIAAISAGAQAELKALDDSAMGELTGQAGLTIDIETQLSIGEFAYVDAGAVVFKDIYRGGQDTSTGERTMLDNIRLTLDVAGATPEGFQYGMSEAKGLAAVHLSNGNATYTEAAAGVGKIAGLSEDTVTGLKIDDERTAGDGDLVLHIGFTDAWEKGGGFAAFANNAGVDGNGNTGLGFADIDYVDARDVATRAVDFQFEIGQIALADEGYAAGVAHSGSAYANGRLGEEVITAATDAGFNGFDTDAGGANTTTLISDLKISGYLGPVDILIENNGNGFGADGSYLGSNVVYAGAIAGGADEATAQAAVAANNNGTGNADSKILWDTFVKVTDLDLYIDIAGVMIEDVRIHNERGDLSSLNTVTYDDAGTPTTVNTSAFGFAHSKREIYAVRNSILHVASLLTGGPSHVSGIAINTQFKGDMDIGAIKFGTDAAAESIGSLHFTDIQSTTNWTISAH